MNGWDSILRPGDISYHFYVQEDGTVLDNQGEIMDASPRSSRPSDIDKAARSNGQVAIALTRLSDSINSLGAVSDEASVKLATVVLLSAPLADNPSPTQPEMSPLAETIHGAADAIDKNVNYLMDLLHRVDL